MHHLSDLGSPAEACQCETEVSLSWDAVAEKPPHLGWKWPYGFLVPSTTEATLPLIFGYLYLFASCLLLGSSSDSDEAG